LGHAVVGIVSGRVEHRRQSPGDEPQQIVDRARRSRRLEESMWAHRKDADITTTQRASVPPLKPDDASPATSLALALSGSNETAKASFAAEAGTAFVKRLIERVRG
jgi:hypothetical protein